MDTNTILLYILIATNLLALIWLVRTELRLKKLLGGKKADELETIIGDIQKGLVSIGGTHDEIKRRLLAGEKRLACSVRNIKTIRYNPFTDSGSNQSFATALLDDHGDGVIISSLYSRERVSVFAKPVKKGVSEYELTDEEEHVLKETYPHA